MDLRTPRRTPRTWLRAQITLTPRDIDGWNDLTDRMHQPPAESLRNFARLHTEVRGEHLPLLWEAFLQWVRVHGRYDERWYRQRNRPVPPPSSRLCQPSLAVDDLWQLLAAHADAWWREFPEHVQVMERVPVRDPHCRTNLYETYAKAYCDEYGSLRLPLLFRIDELLGLDEGRLYRAECVLNERGVPLDRECWLLARRPAPWKSDAGLDPEPVRTCLHEIPWVAIHTGGGGL